MPSAGIDDFFLVCKEIISFSLSDTQDLQETAHILKLNLIRIYRLSFLLHMELNFKMQAFLENIPLVATYSKH